MYCYSIRVTINTKCLSDSIYLQIQSNIMVRGMILYHYYTETYVHQKFSTHLLLYVLIVHPENIQLHVCLNKLQKSKKTRPKFE